MFDESQILLKAMNLNEKLLSRDLKKTPFAAPVTAFDEPSFEGGQPRTSPGFRRCSQRAYAYVNSIDNDEIKLIKCY